ncbi:hypothetical protein MJH12_07830, partial [bacterium]|nr:hypothetical protein [bacterium]
LEKMQKLKTAVDRENEKRQFLINELRRLKTPEEMTKFFEKEVQFLSVFYGGSFARDYQDQYSDIELVILHEDVNLEPLRHYLRSKDDFELIYAGMETGNDMVTDTFIFEKEQIDLIYLKESYLQHQLDQFKQGKRVDPSRQAMVTCYHKIKTLYLKRDYQLKSYAIDLDSKLLEYIVKYANQTAETSMLNIHLKRQDIVQISHLTFNLQRAFLTYLFAINHEFLKGYKNLNHQLARLKEVPDQLAARLQLMHRLDGEDLKTHLQDLYQEIRALALPQENLHQLMPATLVFNSIREKI